MTAREDSDAALTSVRAALSVFESTLSVERQESDQQKAELITARAEIITLLQDAAADADTIAALKTRCVELDAKIKELQDKLRPPMPTLFGANFGGYKSKGETAIQAAARIKAGFGSPDVARWWWSKAPSADMWQQIPAHFQGMSLIIELDGSITDIMAGRWDAAMAAMCQAAPTDRRHVWTFKHEQDNDKATAAEFTPAADRLAKIHAKNSPETLRSAPSMPMAVAFRNAPAPYWRDYLPDDLTGWDCLALDAYQHGKTDATADTAKMVVGQAFDGAKELGLGLVIGELGARRTNQYPDGISDAARAKFLTDFLTQYVDHPDYTKPDGNPILEMVAYFESTDGSSLKVPWCLLNSADGTGVKSPLAAAVWREACSR